MLSDQDGMEQDIAEMKKGLTGTLRLGVVPAAMAAAPLVVTPFCAQHPNVRVQIDSLTSIEIQQRLDSFELEAGLTYLDNEVLRNVRFVSLYRERYVLLTAQPGLFADRDQVPWLEAAQVPLCLLSPSMQNRRIIDRTLEQAGAPPAAPRLETTSMLALCAHVRMGGSSSIVPTSIAATLGGGLRAIPLSGPAASYSLGVVVSDRDPLPPRARAFFAQAKAVDVSVALDKA